MSAAILATGFGQRFARQSDRGEGQPPLKSWKRTILLKIGKTLIAVTILVTALLIIDAAYAPPDGRGGTGVLGSVDSYSWAGAGAEGWGFFLFISLVIAIVVSSILLLQRRERVSDYPLISSRLGSHYGRSQELVLAGSTLRAYWSLLLRRHEPLGLREIQRELGFSSPSSAVYQLAKLTQLGLVEKNNMGDYVVRRTIKVGIIRDFFFIRGTAIAKNEVYFVLSILANTICFILLFCMNAEPLVYLLAMVPGLTSSGIFWHERTSTLKYVRALLHEKDWRSTLEGPSIV